MKITVLISVPATFLFLLLQTFLVGPISADSYYNVGRSDGKATLDADGDVTFSNSQISPDPELVNRLIEYSGADSFVISDEVATNIATVITAAKTDPKTSLLLLRMKQQGVEATIRSTTYSANKTTIYRERTDRAVVTFV
jgi:hypothetical protein